MRTGFVERYGKLAEFDRSFDFKFWQEALREETLPIAELWTGIEAR